MARPYKLFSVILFIGVVFTILFSTQIPYLFSEFKIVDVGASILFFDRLYIDLLVLLLLTLPLINNRTIFRTIAYIIISVFIASITTQFFSVYISSEFVSLLAVDNINHIDLLFNWKSLAIIILAIGSIIIIFGLVEFGSHARITTRYLVGVISFVLSLIILFTSQNYWISPAIISQRDQIYDDREVRVTHKSPVEALFQTVFRSKSETLPRFTESDTLRAKSYGLTIETDKRYPLIKDYFYKSNIQFLRKKNAVEKPNVIVFFVEGMSARIINPYSHLYPQLTPNLDAVSKLGMRVDNYYNHTYATYRGLLGQLCSIFPTRGGQGGWQTHFQDIKSVNYSCLTELLNDNGYQTIFLDSHLKDAAYIDEMMHILNFDQVITAEQVTENHIYEQPLRSDSLSDNQLMRGLISLLEKQLHDSEPYFLGIYNLETHVWQSIAEDGTKYPQKKNAVLDTIHNFDVAFGKFWQYFQNSSFADNTIVIITSDHAHYPGRDFVDLLKEDTNYQRYFIDQIPLIIYDPTKEIPARYDANYTSSIDFAPTISHYLGFENVPNAFLGKSIFDSGVDQNTPGLAAAGDEYYLISKGIIEKSRQDNKHSSELNYFTYLVKTIQQLENHDRIIPKK